MDIIGYVSVCVLFYCMFCFHCWPLSLHASAYFSIFKCVHVSLYLRSLFRCLLVIWSYSAENISR
jgi:hypothetical protein